MRPSDLKKADRKYLIALQDNIEFIHGIMQCIPGVSWNDKRTIVLWLDQIDKAIQLKED